MAIIPALIQSLERLITTGSLETPPRGGIPPCAISPPPSEPAESQVNEQAPPVAARPPARAQIVIPPPRIEERARTSPLQERALAFPSGPLSVVLPPIQAEPVAAEPAEPRAPAVSDSAIRVDVGLLDKLMTLVGELVLARNQIVQFSTSQEDASFLGTVQRLNLLTTELQANVMKTRMQPIGNIWNKFPRVVRDLAVACGKQVRDRAGGPGDRAGQDDHRGHPRPAHPHGAQRRRPRHRAARRAAGDGASRPRAGCCLHAFHEGGKVIIEIIDDGGASTHGGSATRRSRTS